MQGTKLALSRYVQSPFRGSSASVSCPPPPLASARVPPRPRNPVSAPHGGCRRRVRAGKASASGRRVHAAQGSPPPTPPRTPDDRRRLSPGAPPHARHPRR